MPRRVGLPMAMAEDARVRFDGKETTFGGNGSEQIPAWLKTRQDRHEMGVATQRMGPKVGGWAHGRNTRKQGLPLEREAALPYVAPQYVSDSYTAIQRFARATAH